VIALVGAAWAAKLPKLPKWLVAEPPTTLHPLYPTNRTDRLLHGAVHERLFEPEGDGWRSDVVAEVVADGLTLTLTLAPKAWTDGEPLVGADVCATFARLADTAHPTPFSAVATSVVAACVPDPASPARVTLTLARPLPEPRAWLSVPVLPAHRPDWVAFSGGAVEPAFVGLGGPVPKRDGADVLLAGLLRVRVVEDPVARFLAGEGSTVFVPPADLAKLRALPGVELTVAGTPTVWALILNTALAPLDTPEARRALDRGVDRAAVAAALVGRDSGLSRQPWSPISGPFPAGSARTARGVPVPAPPSEGAALPSLGLVVPVSLLPQAAAAFPTFAVTGVEARAWWLSVLAGAHTETAAAALVTIEEPVCAWFETGGPRNVFAWSDPETDRLCGRSGDEAGWSLHGRLADEVPAVFLFSVQDRVARRIAAP
jgi:ABC-type transport system substrate-binding protein